MPDFDVQAIEIAGPLERAFRYVADPRTLPEWTHAFRSVSNGRATLATPKGSVEVGLEVGASLESGTVDWVMTFPDGSVGRAFSRLVPLDQARTLYSFVLLAPPAPLEQVEGALAEQAKFFDRSWRRCRRGWRAPDPVSRSSPVMEESLEDLVRRARGGDRESLERVISAIQDRVYGLALRMLWHPEDARDATQEILVRIVTRLSTFRGGSSFSTWAHRVAANYLPATGESALLLEEVKVGCTLGMLTCLDRAHRLAYILGEILEMEGDEAASVLGIRPAAFRKRLSRARETIVAFTRAKCGLVSPERPCRCHSRVARALQLGRVDRQHLLFATDADTARRFPAVLAEIRRL